MGRPGKAGDQRPGGGSSEPGGHREEPGRPSTDCKGPVVPCQGGRPVRVEDPVGDEMEMGEKADYGRWIKMLTLVPSELGARAGFRAEGRQNPV